MKSLRHMKSRSFNNISSISNPDPSSNKNTDDASSSSPSPSLSQPPSASESFISKFKKSVSVRKRKSTKDAALSDMASVHSPTNSSFFTESNIPVIPKIINMHSNVSHEAPHNITLNNTDDGSKTVSDDADIFKFNEVIDKIISTVSKHLYYRSFQSIT